MGMGGLQNTVMCSAALRLLPIGFPKIICSTIASRIPVVLTRLWATKISLVVPSIVDFAGMNPVNEAVLGNTGQRPDWHGDIWGKTDRYTWGKIYRDNAYGDYE